MPEFVSPGPFVEELSVGPRAIAGVLTSTAGMVGLTERGREGTQLVTSREEYRALFGQAGTDLSFLGCAVRGFFDNGGTRLFASRVVGNEAAAATVALPTVAAGQGLRVTAIGRGEWGNRLVVSVDAGPPPGPGGYAFGLTVLYYETAPPLPFVDPLDPASRAHPNRRDPDVSEQFELSGSDPLGVGDVVTTVNAGSRLIELRWSDTAAAASVPIAAPFTPLAGGGDGTAALQAADYIGDPDQHSGLAGLEAIDEVALLAVPDEVHPKLSANDQTQITDEIVNQCERRRDRFAVLAVGAGQGNVTGLHPPRDSPYGAVYYPWIRVRDPRTADPVLVPPHGHVLGIYARTDATRGVQAPPANVEVAGIALDLSGDQGPLEYEVTRREQDILNPRGINVIRDFRASGRGIRLWGNRTMSSDSQWRYINVRRLLGFVEESIELGTQWAVFEANNEATWTRVVRSVSDFLSVRWRDGALAGATPDQAFLVRCDRTTMTADDINHGRLICLIGIAPAKPAEFVMFRITHKTVEAGV
jgi:phage tail sheath protein FI